MTNGSLTKAELVEHVADAASLTNRRAEITLDTVFGSILEAVHWGEKVELRRFGSFRLRHREPRRGRNPKTGEQVDVPSKRVAYFKPRKELKALINRQSPQLVPPPVSQAGGVKSEKNLALGRVVSTSAESAPPTLTAEHLILTIENNDYALSATRTLSADTAMAQDVKP